MTAADLFLLTTMLATVATAVALIYAHQEHEQAVEQSDRADRLSADLRARYAAERKAADIRQAQRKAPTFNVGATFNLNAQLQKPGIHATPRLDTSSTPSHRHAGQVQPQLSIFHRLDPLCQMRNRHEQVADGIDDVERFTSRMLLVNVHAVPGRIINNHAAELLTVETARLIDKPAHRLSAGLYCRQHIVNRIWFPDHILAIQARCLRANDCPGRIVGICRICRVDAKITAAVCP
jgi:hypothetical protein